MFSSKVKYQLFDNAYLLFSAYYTIRLSQLDYYPLMLMIRKGLMLSTALFSSICIYRYFKWTFINIVLCIPMIIISLYERIVFSTNTIIIVLLMMASYNISFSHICKKTIIYILLGLTIIPLFSLLGIVEDRLYLRDVDGFSHDFAHDLGFKYYSYVSYLGLGLVICLLYIWHKKLNFVRLSLLFVIAYVLFYFSSTRLLFYSSILFIVVTKLLQYIPYSWIFNKMSLLLCLISYPFICIILYIVSKYMLLHIILSDFTTVNRMLSNRLSLNEEAFRRYDVNMFGCLLEEDASEFTSDYFFIDSGYLHALFQQGVIFTALLIITYMILIYKLYKSRQSLLFVWMFIFSIMNIVNGFMFDPLTNPIVMLSFSSLSVISACPPSKSIYRLHKKQQDKKYLFYE